MFYRMYLIKIVGWMHIICYFIKNTYGIYSMLIPINIQKKIDVLYLLVFIGLFSSWLILKDECLISYFVKKISNPEYRLGDEPNNIEDITVLFENKEQYKKFEYIMTISYIVSLYIVANRVLIPNKVTILVLILYCIYNKRILYYE